MLIWLFKSLRLISSRFASVRRFEVATESVISSEKSVTSALTSKYSGISRSAFFPSKLMLRLSLRPGIVIPTTTLLSEASTTLPFVTSTLLKLSFGSIIPVIIVNGTYACFDLPFTVIVFLRLFV